MRIDGLEASNGEDFDWLNTEEESGEIVNCPVEQNVDTVSRDECGGQLNYLKANLNLLNTILKKVNGTKHEPLFNRLLQYLAEIADCDALKATFTRTTGTSFASEELDNIFWKQLESLLSIFESAKSNIQMTSAVDNNNNNNNNNNNCSSNNDSNNKQEAPNKTTVLPPPPPPPPLLSLNCGSTFKHNIINNNTLPCRNRDSKFAASSGQLSSTDASTTEDELTQTNGGSWTSAKQRWNCPPLDNDDNLKSETECKHGEAASIRLPTPNTKLKTLPWHKVPSSKVTTNGNNIWLQGAKRFDASCMPDLNMLEQLFAAGQRTNPSLLNTHFSNGSAAGSDFADPCTSNVFDDSSTKHNRSTMSTTTERRRKETVEINLLDPKRSINVNIFLKQFRGGVEELANLIRCNRADEIGGPEKLRGMIKILPDQDEMEIIEGFTGDRTKLGDAEKFFLHLREIPYYRIRVETMLLKSEFAAIIEGMKSSLEIMLRAAREVLKSRALPDLLYLVLLVGNYLNSGVYSGNACGFRLVSLWNLVDVRANLPNVTLIHYFAAEAEKKNQKLLSFCEELPHVEEASKISLDILYADYRSMQERTRKASHQVSKCDKELLEQVEKFVEHASKELSDVDRLLKQLDNLRIQLAEFFCEDLHSFKLDEAFKVIANFQQKFKKALQENHERLSKELKTSSRQRNAPDCTTESQLDGRSKSSSSKMAENQAKPSSTSDLALQDVLKQEENQQEKVNLGCYWGLSSRRPSRQRALWLASENCRERPKFPTLPACLQGNSAKIKSCNNSLLSEYEQKAKSQVLRGDSNQTSVSGSSSHSLPSERMHHHVDVEEEKKIFKSTTCALSTDCLGRKYSTGCRNFEKEIISADLNGFLELLELEKEQMESSLYGRRFKNTRKDNFTIPRCDSSSMSVLNASFKTDIDEVVRQCEETCVEIDQLGIEADASDNNVFLSNGCLRGSRIEDDICQVNNSSSSVVTKEISATNNDNQQQEVGMSHSHSTKKNHRDMLSTHKTANCIIRSTTCSTVQQKHNVRPGLAETTNSGLLRKLKLKSDKCTSAANRTNSGGEYGHDGDEGFETASLSTVSSDRLTPVGRNAEDAVEVKTVESQRSKIASKLSRGGGIGAKYLKPTKSSTAKTTPSVKVDSAAKAVVRLPFARRNVVASSTATATAAKSTACQAVLASPIAKVNNGTKEKNRLRPAMADKTSNNSNLKLSNPPRQNVLVRKKREGAAQTTNSTTNQQASTAAAAVAAKSQVTEPVKLLASVQNSVVVGGRGSVPTLLKRTDENSSVVQKPKCVPASHNNRLIMIKEPTNRNCNDKRWQRLKSPPKSTLNLLGQPKSSSISRNRKQCPDNPNLQKPNSTTTATCKKNASLPPWR
ncbi:FH2 domain-containing protein 1 [Trichinella pseudospiralis]|uniref:FH2 domain-containing protein 1 n=2 Tax=Trichinella pseudospiralis TaxID=6337 RepID=A0A0V1KDI3_TRIPS|nr:FH2 domain-containing protein 1 [Trichinella pseudospiralis]KRZ45217.1 FH2 domain-containing protein 1 [Trichinella pseudospiralis]